MSFDRLALANLRRLVSFEEPPSPWLARYSSVATPDRGFQTPWSIDLQLVRAAVLNPWSVGFADLALKTETTEPPSIVFAFACPL